MVTIATDGNYKVAQVNASQIALFCTGGRYAHETPMYITGLENLDTVVENMHKNANMMRYSG